jgi:hypothetical protein
VWTVAILALIPSLAWAADLPSGEPRGVRLAISATTERIPLPGLRGPIELTVDAMSRVLRVRLSKKDAPAAFAARIASHIGMLCPRVEVKDDGVELGCRSRRIEAQITTEGQGQGKGKANGEASYLDINELRGLPWRAGPDAAPSYHYDPWRTGLGQSCPGKSEAAQGECELKEGHTLQAAIHFRAALDSMNRQMACVRLGDLAIGIGDPITASGWYRRAGSHGVFGRVAETRLCEMDGRCLESTAQVVRTFDSSGMPEPLRAELMLRGARAEAYAGRLPSAIHMIARQVGEHGMASICREGGELLCRRILLEAMRAAEAINAMNPGNPTRPSLPIRPADAKAFAEVKPPGAAPAGSKSVEKTGDEYLEELLETYLEMPSWEKGQLAVELSQAAAPLAARLGAPGFGGNLLASLAPEVPDAQLSNHLLLATETFLKGKNWARARIVAEYAQTRLGAKGKDSDKRARKGARDDAGAGAAGGLDSAQALRDPRWVAVFRMLKERAEGDEVSPEVQAAVEAELAGTLIELKNARAAMDKAESVLGSARDARASREPANQKPAREPNTARAPGGSSAAPSPSGAPKRESSL